MSKLKEPEKKFYRVSAKSALRLKLLDLLGNKAFSVKATTKKKESNPKSDSDKANVDKSEKDK